MIRKVVTKRALREPALQVSYGKRMAHTVVLGGLAAALLLSTSVSWAASPSDARRDDAAGIRQLVQKREGRQSCWGVVIRLKRLTFKRSILPTQLEIRDDKPDSALRNALP